MCRTTITTQNSFSGAPRCASDGLLDLVLAAAALERTLATGRRVVVVVYESSQSKAHRAPAPDSLSPCAFVKRPSHLLLPIIPGGLYG